MSEVTLQTLLLACLTWAANAAAATLTVDAAGGDYRTIAAAIARAQDGDTVRVKPGTYRESIRPRSHLRLVAEAGPVRTRVFVERGGRALFLDQVQDVVIEGFDFCSVPGAGKPGDGFVAVTKCADITIRDCYVHDAPNDADCIKVSDTRRLVLERCCVWNPGRRGEQTGFQEGMDTRAKDFEITVRGCWFFQTEQGGDTLIFCKGGCFDILWEDNIFGPSVGQGHANVPVQSGHQNAGERGDEVPTYPSGRFVVRNNLFVGLRGEAAFGFQGPDTSLLYNNVFYRNETTPSLITITDNPGSVRGPALRLFSLNNLFAANGDVPYYRQRNAPKSLANLKVTHNAYAHDAGGDVKISAEPGALIGRDPLFVAPQIPAFDFAKGPAQIQAARAGFRLSPGSPARGAGTDPFRFAAEAHPSAIPAMRMTVPADERWDIGLRDFGPAR